MKRAEIITALLEQARDKDTLANYDPNSIFTFDANVLTEAAPDRSRTDAVRRERLDIRERRAASKGHGRSCMAGVAERHRRSAV